MNSDNHTRLQLVNGGVRRYPGRLAWCGEHWIAAVNEDGSNRPGGWFSLYVTRYSAAGEGIALHFLSQAHDAEWLLAERPELGRFISETFFARSSQPPSDEVPLTPARFIRDGDIRDRAGWRVDWQGHRLRAEWRALGRPEVAFGAFREGNDHFTALCFTEQVTITFDGKVLPGGTYERDLWTPSLGAPRSSSVVAVAESLLIME